MIFISKKYRIVFTRDFGCYKAGEKYYVQNLKRDKDFPQQLEAFFDDDSYYCDLNGVFECEIKDEIVKFAHLEEQ